MGIPQETIYEAQPLPCATTRGGPSTKAADRVGSDHGARGGSFGSPEATQSLHIARGTEPPYRVIDRGKLRIDLTPGVEGGAKPSCGAEPFPRTIGKIDPLPGPSNGLYSVKPVVDQPAPLDTLVLPVNLVHHGWVRARNLIMKTF